MSVDLSHRQIVANGVVHHYVTGGHGAPLVLLHGFPQTWLQWMPMIDRLAEKFTIIAPNLRGLGGNPGPATGYDKHSLAHDVHAIVHSAVGDQPIVLCGHDMGGCVAFAYALNHRDSVRSLVLVDTPLPGTSLLDAVASNPRAWHIAFHSNVDVAHMLIAGRERAYISQFVRARSYDQAAVTEDAIDAYAAAYAAPGAMRAGLEWYRALGRDAELNRAAIIAGGKLTMPVTFAASGVTADVPNLTAMLSEIATDTRFEIVEGAGHWIPEEQPERLVAMIEVAAGLPV
ncbi:alpha/beta hydrolase [Actinomadura madurae]|uniref:alpha/beta fold hydrolase n=1 Tax=Actinomadura madurae TaxID=1993 RepID=UPI00399BB0A0